MPATLPRFRSAGWYAGQWLSALLLFHAFCLPFALTAADELVRNGGFEQGFEGWTRWGRNADLITLDSGIAHTGTNCARVRHGRNALYLVSPLSPQQAYELRFAYRLAGSNPAGQIALGFFRPGDVLRSAGGQNFKITPPAGKGAGEWAEFRQVFLPTRLTSSCQFAFTAGEGATLWIDDVSLRPVPRSAELAEPAAPWEGLAHRTAKPLFKELLTKEPGGYTVISWAHDLNPRSKQGFKSDEFKDDAKWQKEVQAIFKETGEAGMGFMDLPGRLDGAEPWRTAEFHREQFRRYGVRYDVFSENSASTAAGLKNGAELLNASGREPGAKPSLSWVDPAYVGAQSNILRKLGARLRGDPFVGYYYGKDEPTIHIPEGAPASWGRYGQAMAKDVREQYGFGRFDVPLPKEQAFLTDPNKPFRWIAYNRWMNDRFIETRCQLSQALQEADPGARYSPANYWFMGGFPLYDYSRLAACSDLMECDPYASSAERSRGRGVYNHGFGAKFMADLSGKPVRVVAQAFNYAGYDMTPDDLREWVSQALRCGASAIDYYEMDSPHWSDPARWKMMLHLSGVITRMNRIALPRTADTAILYTLYTHMSQGATTSGDQVYAAHALVGELAGSWFKFISDAQLERGDAKLSGYKVVYLPRAKYMTPEAARIIEDYVRAGGVLVCGDAEAFGFDLAGNNTCATRERILGIRTLGPKHCPEQPVTAITLKSAQWGLHAKTTLRLFDTKAGEETALGCAHEIALADPKAQILGVYPDGSSAIVLHKLGKGRVITFAANPFAPQVTVDKSAWPDEIKGLQQSLGCQVDQPIWRFLLPTPPPSGASSLSHPSAL
jgi:hypothetical protein